MNKTKIDKDGIVGWARERYNAGVRAVIDAEYDCIEKQKIFEGYSLAARHHTNMTLQEAREGLRQAYADREKAKASVDALMDILATASDNTQLRDSDGNVVYRNENRYGDPDWDAYSARLPEDEEDAERIARRLSDYVYNVPRDKEYERDIIAGEYASIVLRFFPGGDTAGHDREGKDSAADDPGGQDLDKQVPIVGKDDLCLHCGRLFEIHIRIY